MSRQSNYNFLSVSITVNVFCIPFPSPQIWSFICWGVGKVLQGTSELSAWFLLKDFVVLLLFFHVIKVCGLLQQICELAYFQFKTSWTKLFSPGSRLCVSSTVGYMVKLQMYTKFSIQNEAALLIVLKFCKKILSKQVWCRLFLSRRNIWEESRWEPWLACFLKFAVRLGG